ncbi:MAG: hypothetical protein GF311_08250, partial [Candidatus Lokiarchaeota archaeon]|nr:hypothetical protein [Candidatus Lokiarchaeota archaeon]
MKKSKKLNELEPECIFKSARLCGPQHVRESVLGGTTCSSIFRVSHFQKFIWTQLISLRF